MKNKGFTLIELLAVIVILAIIALIATPIVLNLINDSRKESMRLSAENYLDAVEVSLANAYMKDNGILLSDTYKISENGKKIVSETNKKEISVEFDGTPIKEGSLKVEKGNVEYIDVARIDEWYAIIVSDRVKLVKDILVDGSSFRDSMFYDAESIEFLPNGKLPEGYTKTEFNDLLNSKETQKSVSLNGYVKAIYDEVNKKTFIYSDGDIVFNKDSSRMFESFTYIKKIVFNDVITSIVEDMSYMFAYDENLEELDLSSFNTSNVTNMSEMFKDIYSLEELDLSSFDTSNVTDMSYMFFAFNITKLDLSSFNTSNVTSMCGMFGSTALNEDVENELNLSSFDTSNVTDMDSMFYQSSLTNLDLSSFDTSNVTDMDSMFEDCTNLTNLDLRNATFDNVEIDKYYWGLDDSIFNGVPVNIYIITKNEDTKSWLQERDGLDNAEIVTVAELQQQS